MKNLPHWGQLLPLLGATLAYYIGLGWWKQARSEAGRECGHPPGTLKRGPYPAHVYRELPTEEFCEGHNCWFERECPGCRDEWEQTWTLTAEDEGRRDDWADSEEERWAAEDDGETDPFWIRMAEERERRDQWYQDLVNRANHPGTDPHSGWREV